jgi:hypothetical protein
LHVDLLAFLRGMALQGDRQLTEDEYTVYGRDFIGRIFEIADEFEKHGIRGTSRPIFAAIGPYASASSDTLALATDRLRETIEQAQRR